MGEGTISRRALFARLIGRGEPRTTRPAEDPERTPEPEPAPGQKRIESYLEVLDRYRDRLAFGVEESELPEPRDSIKEALVAALPAQPREALRQALREAYGSLAWFTSGQELECLRAGKRSLEFMDQSEDGKAALVAAFSIRAEKVREMAALEKEFDQRVTARLAGTSEPSA